MMLPENGAGRRWLDEELTAKGVCGRTEPASLGADRPGTRGQD